MTTNDNVSSLALTACLFVALMLGLLLFVCSSPRITAAQDSTPPGRLSVHLQCPKYAVSGRFPITLYADILGTDDPEILNPIVFKWTVSEGKLLSGQGTRSIVLADLKNENLKVHVEAEGGPPWLVFEKTCTLRVDLNCTLTPIFDQYTSISLAEEHKRLDRLAGHLKQAPPSSRAYIIAYSGKSSCIYEASWRAERARQYLIKTHSLPSDRLVVVDGGFREAWAVELFVQPTDSCGPLPSPRLTRRQVRIEGQCADQ